MQSFLATTNVKRLVVTVSMLTLAIPVLAQQGGKAHAGRPNADHERCLDKFCVGDTEPRKAADETALKLNGRWFVGPRKYFSSSSNAGSFEWWDHRPLDPAAPRPTDAQVAALTGKGYDFSIQLFFRSYGFPPEPHGYRLIEMAQTNGWLESRKTLRAGLDVIRMKHVVGPSGHRIDHVTYYVATELRGRDGLPPVATCNHDHTSHGGGTGFMWRPGIWAGTRMNQKHCADWPEIYLETDRILSLLMPA